jgi:putative mRNA 3-end processing factor
MKSLSARGFRFCAHPSIHAISQLYAELGMPVGEVRRFDGTIREGEVGFFPPFAKGRAYQAISPRATAVLTGWAQDPAAVRRYGADVAFALSDHADCASLVRYAKQTGANEVITHHGFARELAETMRAEGIDARAVGTRQQLSLF